MVLFQLHKVDRGKPLFQQGQAVVGGSVVHDHRDRRLSVRHDGGEEPLQVLLSVPIEDRHGDPATDVRR